MQRTPIQSRGVRRREGWWAVSGLFWLPVLFVALLIVPAALGLDGKSGSFDFKKFKSFRDRMRKNEKE